MWQVWAAKIAYKMGGRKLIKGIINKIAGDGKGDTIVKILDNINKASDNKEIAF
jgi:hypothetical protein